MGQCPYLHELVSTIFVFFYPIFIRKKCVVPFGVLWKTDARTFSQEREGTFGENKKGNSKKDIFKLPDIHNALFVYLASFMTPSM